MREFFDNEDTQYFQCTAKELALEVSVVKDYASKFLIFLSELGVVENLGRRKQDGPGKPAYLFQVPKTLTIDFGFLLDMTPDKSTEEEWMQQMRELGFSDEELISIDEVNETSAIT